MLRTFAFAAALVCAPAAWAQAEPSPVTIGESFALQSTALSETREINVWLPPSYAEGDQRYPVVYVLDGARDQDFHHISGLVQLATINGAHVDLIVVGIGTRTRIAELTPAPRDARFRRGFPNAGGADRFRRYIAEEVIPFVAQRYRVSERRALMGESLAGLFVADAFLKQPDLFTDYIAVDASLWWDSGRYAADAPRLLARHTTNPRTLYITQSNAGGMARTGFDTFMSALHANTPRNLTLIHVDRTDSATHASIYHPAALDALTQLFPYAEPFDYGPDPWWNTPDQQPPAE